ncbi:MAG TPA: glycine zipper 2TM domain-containing protein [Pseudomonadales bacterium]|nr:glycine zipper 2TM domain-containing protein [Pseudomonadales bacterium]
MRRLLPCILACFYLAACANKLTGDVYSRDDARQQMQVNYGTVTSVRPVVIEGNRDGFLGQAGGAVIGGIAGNALGGGHGRSLTTAVGAIGGAVAGSAVQEKATRAQALEIVVRRDNGEEILVTQEVKSLDEFYKGQRVRLSIGGGNTRVAPANN